MRRIALSVFSGILTLPLLIGVGGCERGGEAAEAEAPKSSAASTDGFDEAQREVDRQRALPYSGGREIDDDEEGGVDWIKADRMQPGYTLFSVHMRAMARLIDERGNVIHTWRDPDGRHWDNIELLPNGDLITTGADPAPVQGIKDEARYAMRLTWDGKVVWKKYLFAHHDITQTPNGDLLTLTFQRRDEPSIHPTIQLRDDLITRMTMDGEVTQTVSIFDAVRAKPELFPLEKNKPTSMGGRTWIDNFHLNSVEQMHFEHLFARDPIYEPQNVLICSRHQDRIAILNMSTGELLWAWGRGELDGPHDATVLENGHIMVFDNGLVRGYSRVIELDPLTKSIVWQYVDPKRPEQFYTKSKGSNQRLANGNTLICNSDNGEIFEVTPEGETVWRYLSTDRIRKGDGRVLRAAFVRAYRYDREFIDRLIAEHGE
ncbi:MAG: hypothetical protein D6744_16025 [Planctomycetota bacterium]|nr:MAG: hypothetical protein D6744_16025 [Planctomycetota bacterium]